MNSFNGFMRRGLISLVFLVSLSAGLAVQDDLVNLTDSPCIFSGPASTPYNRCTIFIRPGYSFNLTFNVSGIYNSILTTGNNQLDSLTVFLDNIDDVHPGSYHGFDLQNVTNWESQYFGIGDWKISKDIDDYDYLTLGENFNITVLVDSNISEIDVDPVGGMTNLTGYYNYNDDDTADSNNFVAIKSIDDPTAELVYITVYVDPSFPLFANVSYWNELNETIGGLDYVSELLDDGIKFRGNVTDLPDNFPLTNVKFIWNQTNPFTNETMTGVGDWWYFNLTKIDGLIENTTVYYKISAMDNAGNHNESGVYAVFPRDYPVISDTTTSPRPPGVNVSSTAVIDDFSRDLGLNVTIYWNTTGPNTNPVNVNGSASKNITLTSYSQNLGIFDEGDVINYTITVIDIYGWANSTNGSIIISQDNPVVTNITHNTDLPDQSINVTANITDLSAFNASIICNVTVNYPGNNTFFQVSGDMHLLTGDLYTYNIGVGFNENDTIACFINATDKYGYKGNNTHDFSVQQDYPFIYNLTESTHDPGETITITANITDLSDFTPVLYYDVNNVSQVPINMVWDTGDIWKADVGPFSPEDFVNYTINATDKYNYNSTNSSSFTVLGQFNVTFHVRDMASNVSLADVNVTFNSSTTDFDYNISFYDLIQGNYTFLFQKTGYQDNTSTYYFNSNHNITIYMQDIMPPEIIEQRLNITANSTGYCVTVQAIVQENGHLNFSYFNYSWWNNTLIDGPLTYNCTNTAGNNWTCTYSYLGCYDDEYRLLYFHTYAEDDTGLYDNESAGAHHIYFFTGETVILSEDTHMPHENITITARVEGYNWTSATLYYTVDGTDNYVVNMTNSSFSEWQGTTIQLCENMTVNYTIISSRGGSYTNNFTTLWDYPTITDLNETSHDPNTLITISGLVSDLSPVNSTIYYSINGINQSSIGMTKVGSFWKATFGPFNPGTNITYWINATDYCNLSSLNGSSFRIKDVFNTTFIIRDLLTDDLLDNVNLSYDSTSDIINGVKSFDIKEGNHTFIFTRSDYGSNVTTINITTNNTYTIYLKDNAAPIIVNQTINVSNAGTHYVTDVWVVFEDESNLTGNTLYYSFDTDSLANSTNMTCTQGGDYFTCFAHVGNFTEDEKDIYYRAWGVDAYGNQVLGDIIRSRIEFGNISCPTCPPCNCTNVTCPDPCPPCPDCICNCGCDCDCDCDCPDINVTCANATTCDPEIVTVTTTETLTKSLLIEAPWIVEAVGPSDTVTLTLRNSGEVALKDLMIYLDPRFDLAIDYNNSIGELGVGDSILITANLSDFNRVYDFVFINVTDGSDEWTSSLIVYVPDQPLGVADCVQFIPELVVIKDCVGLSALHCNAYNTMCDSNTIKIKAVNVCDESLTGVAINIQSLGYYEFVDILNEEHEITIDVGPNPPTEFVATASYVGGVSSDVIQVSLLNPISLLISLVYTYEFFLVVVLVSALLIIFILIPAYYTERRRVKKVIAEETVKRVKITQEKKKLKRALDEETVKRAKVSEERKRLNKVLQEESAKKARALGEKKKLKRALDEESAKRAKITQAVKKFKKVKKKGKKADKAYEQLIKEIETLEQEHKRKPL